ncbi:8717_t:CDS:2 [Gigaspora margarita]|uniref:8717_t:CDS:1 n=1 Tax=Gigaspora margarita TaxID=4874 RepID=A0ABM8VWL4_GIGMA|nr:8717_t:CDS:2 [Gigaspora margarita]
MKNIFRKLWKLNMEIYINIYSFQVEADSTQINLDITKVLKFCMSQLGIGIDLVN